MCTLYMYIKDVDRVILQTWRKFKSTCANLQLAEFKCLLALPCLLYLDIKLESQTCPQFSHLASCERAHLYSPLQMFPADSKIGKLGMTNLHHSTICTEILSVNSFRWKWTTFDYWQLAMRLKELLLLLWGVAFLANKKLYFWKLNIFVWSISK